MSPTDRVDVPVLVLHPERQPPAGVPEPVTFGVPLPQGRVRPDEVWTLGPFESPQPVQARALDRWPDGSVRWLLVDAQLASRPADGRLVLGREPDAPALASRVSVDTASGTTIVDTGAATFRFGVGGPMPFQSVVVDGREQVDPASSGLHLTTAAGARESGSVEAIAIEEDGPLRAVVRLDATVATGDSGPRLVVTVRVHLFAGLTAARVILTVRNPEAARHQDGFWDLGDPGSILFRALDLVLACGGGASGRLEGSVTPDDPWTGREGFDLYQDSSGGEAWHSSNHLNRERRIPQTFQGYELRSGGRSVRGDRAQPAAAVGDARVAVGGTLAHFWQNHPKRLAAEEGRLTFGLFPGEFSDLHELQGGEQKTHEVWLAFGSPAWDPSLWAWARGRTVLTPVPEWIRDSDAVSFLAPLDAAQQTLIEAAVDPRVGFAAKREVIDEFGWRHFGEIYGDHESVRQLSPPLVSHYNNQYDPVMGLTFQFLRSADPRWWRLATELAEHVVDIDVYHTRKDRAAYNHGLFWHTYHYGDADIATHRTYPRNNGGHTAGGGPSADHNYTTGLMTMYYLTGDLRYRETVVGLGGFVIDIDDGGLTVLRWIDRGSTGGASSSIAGYHGPGRGPANSLNALIDAHRLSGDPAYLAMAERLIRRVVHPTEDIARHRLDEPEIRWFYTMFLQSLGKYLAYKADAGQNDEAYAYAHATMLHYARWMAAHEVPYLSRPEKLEFPTETWAAQDIRKTDVFVYAALCAEGAERDRFLERAAFFHAYAVTTLAAAPTRTLARPIVILLIAGHLLAWWQARNGAALPAPAVDAHAGAPARFVPQRQRALRKLVGLAALGGLAVVVLLVWLLLW